MCYIWCVLWGDTTTGKCALNRKTLESLCVCYFFRSTNNIGARAATKTFIHLRNRLECQSLFYWSKTCIYTHHENTYMYMSWVYIKVSLSVLFKGSGLVGTTYSNKPYTHQSLWLHEFVIDAVTTSPSYMYWWVVTVTVANRHCSQQFYNIFSGIRSSMVNHTILGVCMSWLTKVEVTSSQTFQMVSFSKKIGVKG